jgi:hypothetical protein
VEPSYTSYTSYTALVYEFAGLITGSSDRRAHPRARTQGSPPGPSPIPICHLAASRPAPTWTRLGGSKSVCSPISAGVLGAEDPQRGNQDSKTPGLPCPAPPPLRCTRPAPQTLPHAPRRCTRPRPPAHARLLEGKAPPPSVGAETPPPRSRPFAPPPNSDRGWAGRDGCREGILTNEKACRA